MGFNVASVSDALPVISPSMLLRDVDMLVIHDSSLLLLRETSEAMI